MKDADPAARNKAAHELGTLGVAAEPAIPALIAYNKLQGEVAKNQARMESFADEFSAILSRQIDQHAGAERDRMAA